MRKKFIKTISLFICLMIAVSVFCMSLVSCKKKDTSESESVSETPSIAEPEAKAAYKGTHNLTATETSDYLVKDGKTDYVLVADPYASGTERTAKEEFKTLFKQATGINIQEASADGLVHNSSAKYISIGENDLFRTSGIELDKIALTDEGVRIVTKDKTVYIVGGGQYGTLYAVYDFMQITFNYEQYYLDCMEIDTGVTEKKLLNYDVTDIPDMLRRSTNFGFLTQEFKNRLRMPLYSGSYLLPIHAKMTADGVADRNSRSDTVHNSNEYLPRDDAEYSKHADWFGDAGDVLCYTAHGNSEELELMAQACAKKIEASLMAYTTDLYPNMNAVSLTVEDNNDTCSCDSCSRDVERYGSPAASLMIFINKVNEYLRIWMDENKDNKLYYRENFELVFFAYNSFAIAPVHFDEATGKYVANAPELQLDEGVSVWLALRYMLMEELNIYNERNDNGREQIAKWAAISDGLWLWTYSTNFQQYLFFHDAFSLFNSEGYRFFAAHNVKYYYQNSQSYQTGASTGFHALSIYLQSKLAWDSSLSTEELTEKFMNAMFKDAAPIMKSMLESMKLHNAKYKKDTEYVTTVAVASNFPYATLQNWLNMCDDAIESIEQYKNVDPKLYETLKTRIDVEWIFPAYAMLQLRSDYLTEKDLSELNARFKETGLRLGMSRIKEIEADGALTAYLNSL